VPEENQRTVFMFNLGKKTENVSQRSINHLIPENTLRILIIIFVIIAIGVLAINYLSGSIQIVLMAIFFIALMIVSYVLIQRGNPIGAQITLPTALFIIVLFAVISNRGLHDAGMFAFAIVIALAGLTLGQSGVYAFAVLVIFSIFGLGISELREVFVSEVNPTTTWTSIASAILLVIAYTAIQGTLTYILSQNAKIARENENNQINANKELHNLHITLEDKVKEENLQAQKHAKQIEAISDVVHAMASIRDMVELLNSSSDLISKNFGYGQVAIFLLDENRKRIVLRAASSDGEWQKLLDGGYALSVDSKSNIGNVAKNQTKYTSLQTQHDNLPEIIVPIKVGSRLIGVLYIQSNRNDNFSQDDIMIATTLSDQLAVAIENSRLMESKRNEMIETVQSFQNYVKQSWYQYTQRRDQNEYRYQNGEILAGKSQESNLDINKKGKSRLSIPLYVRGQKIGVLEIKSRNNLRKWTKDEIALVEAASERTALALETARLLEDSQRRANREQAIGEISTKITATTDTETILQTAVMELGRQIGSAKVSIEINPESIMEEF